MNQEMIEQYVTGRLGKDEAEAFEAYCVANPEFARQVEYEQRLRAGIREVAAGSTAEFVRSNHPHGWKVALAAGLVIAVALGFYAWTRGGSVHPTQILAGVTPATSHPGPALRLAMVRGAESIPALPEGVVRVEIVGLFDTGYHYTISLDRLEKQKNVENISTVYGQHPTSPLSLEVMIDGDRLRAGTYSLRVRKQTSDEEPLDFGFVKR
jgi:hypothetical protein